MVFRKIENLIADVDGWVFQIDDLSIDFTHRKLDVCRLLYGKKHKKLAQLIEFEGSFVVEGKTDVPFGDRTHTFSATADGTQLFSLKNTEFRIVETSRKYLRVGFMGECVYKEEE